MVDDSADRIARVIADLRPLAAPPDHQAAVCSLSERMAHFASPGVSIAVIEHGRVAWEHGFGVRTNGQPEPVGTETLFQAGSVSKPVFALGAMRLVQQGRIALDDDIRRYLTSCQIRSKGSWAPHITLRQLLSHTAGTSVHGFPGYPAAGPWPTLTQILNGEPPANNLPVVVDMIPGLQVKYSGGGTTIAQAAITEVAGRPLPDLMRELIFEPLALENSTYSQPLPTELAARSATAHAWNGVPMPGQWHVYPEMAAAGLWTTAGDLARIGCAFVRTLQGDDSPFGLSREAAAEMLKPQFQTHVDGEDFFGLGWECAGKGEAFQCRHLGWNEGFVAGLWLYPAVGKGAAIMINSNQGWPLRDEIKEAIAREYDWPGSDSGSLVQPLPKSVGGIYRSEHVVVCEVTTDGTSLMLRIDQQPPLAFVLTESGLVSNSVEASLNFLPSLEAATALVLNQAGRSFRFEK
jgi:CubicO group peptidase (beta-lactamase class C family)